MKLENMTPEHYKSQLTEKTLHLNELFKSFNPPTLEVFASAPTYYRMRAEFRVWHDQEDLYYFMNDKETKEKIRVDQFPVATELINHVMEDLITEIKENQSLRRKLFQVDFLSTLSEEILVSMLYHRQLDDDWIEEARALKGRLSAKYKINFVGRARKQKIILDEDFVVERLTVCSEELIYKQVENSFTQPNAEVAVKMLEWSKSISQDATGDLLELYCGNGNFSIALSPHYEKVLATELSSSSVDSAQFNIEVNGVNNLKIIRMSAEDFSEALKGTREFFRLKDVDLKSYNFQTVLVDPPRSGLDAKTLSMISGYERIIYISCNPETLHENLETLSLTHKVTRFALFDQFPYTHHVEAGVLLEKK